MESNEKEKKETFDCMDCDTKWIADDHRSDWDVHEGRKCPSCGGANIVKH